MSAHFIVRFNGAPMRFTWRGGRRQFYPVPDPTLACPFTSEAEAWTTAYQYGLRGDGVSVENRNVPSASGATPAATGETLCATP